MQSMEGRGRPTDVAFTWVPIQIWLTWISKLTESHDRNAYFVTALFTYSTKRSSDHLYSGFRVLELKWITAHVAATGISFQKLFMGFCLIAFDTLTFS